MAAGKDVECGVQVLTKVLGPAATRVLADFTQVASVGAVNAVTGESMQDRMLVDTGIRLSEVFKLRDQLGPIVFLHALALQQSDRQSSRYRTGYSGNEAHFLLFLGHGNRAGSVVLGMPQVGDLELSLEPGDCLALPQGSSWFFPHDGDRPSRWLHLGYAKGDQALEDAPNGVSVGIRLWGDPARSTWRDLGLPARGPNNAKALFVEAFPLDVSAPGEIVAGRTDTLYDLRLRIAGEPGHPVSPLHETLVIPLDGGEPRFLPCGQATAAGPAAIVLDWTACPRIEAEDMPALTEGMPAETTYLTKLQVSPRSLTAGDRGDIPLAMGDQLLVLRAGSVAVGAQMLTAPAVILVPTGSFASYAATIDAELLHVLLERGHAELGPKLPVSAAATVAFCIPLAPRDRMTDWALATRLFNAALRAIHDQSDPNWIIVAVGNEMPELTVRVDERFHFIASTIDATDGSLSAAFEDASKKRRRAEERARELGADYLFFSDWDDIVHPDFVQFIRATRHPYGYVAGRGYLIDFEMQDVSPFPVWAGGGSLDELCTSTLVFNAHAVNPILGDTEFNYVGHVRQRYLMHAEGRPLMEIPFPSVAYMRFTTLNLSNAMVTPKADGSTKFPQMRKTIAAHSVRNDETVRENFGLSALFDDTGDRGVTCGPKRLSVLICTHNRPDGLAALLASLVPQIAGHPEREIIVVNDGTHNARYSSVVGRYATAIRYHPLPRNVGIARARNRAAELALGEYLVFTDDDCEVPRSWLDWVDANLNCQPELDVVAGFTRPLRPDQASLMGRVQTAFDLLPRPFILGEIDLSFVTACLAVRAKTFRRAGGFAAGHSFATASEDTDLAMRLARLGARVRVDQDWHVFHELAKSIVSEFGRFRRYGYGNRQLATLPYRPSSHQYLLALKYWRLPHYFLGHFHRNRDMAARFKGNRREKLFARLVAALVATGYDFGAVTNRPH